ncbi:MAG: NTP transferase domain-containing protein [Dorea sp.]|nr:NTP transferase domain-containing protein [Dorea sp.]
MKTYRVIKNDLEKYISKPDISIVDAMRKIDENAGMTLIIVDENNRLAGCVSDGDIRRSLISDGKMDKPIGRVMNISPKYVYEINDLDDAWKKYPALPMIPVVDEYLHVKAIGVWSGFVVNKKKPTGKLLDVPVVIMAGGKGTRLYPYTKILPKPLIPIGDIPILERIIEKYTEYGMYNFYLTINYKKGMIKSYFDELEPSYKLHYVEEGAPLGTVGSLRLIEETFKCPIFVANCDTLIDADYEDIYRQHVESGSAITIISALKNFSIPYGVLHSEEGGIVTAMKEKPSMSYFINTGMYVINPEIIDMIPQGQVFHMPMLAEILMEKGKKVMIYPVSEESFLDMGEFEEMKRMEKKLKDTEKKNDK